MVTKIGRKALEHNPEVVRAAGIEYNRYDAERRDLEHAIRQGMEDKSKLLRKRDEVLRIVEGTRAVLREAEAAKSDLEEQIARCEERAATPSEKLDLVRKELAKAERKVPDLSTLSDLLERVTRSGRLTDDLATEIYRETAGVLLPAVNAVRDVAGRLRRYELSDGDTRARRRTKAVELRCALSEASSRADAARADLEALEAKWLPVIESLDREIAEMERVASEREQARRTAIMNRGPRQRVVIR